MPSHSEPRIDFLVIGAAKCATTWLQRALCGAPEVWMPAPELHFFSRHYDRGMAWYLAQFEAAGAARILGEKSNTYLSDPAAAERIHRHLPGVRLLVQLREPTARAYSDYCMLYRRGEVSADIRRHLDPDRASAERFLADGHYARQLEPYYALFGRAAILPLVYEEVVADPTAQLARVARHLGLATSPPVPTTGRVKDRATPLVPRALRRLVGPARHLLDPIRGTPPVRALRAAVARPVTHPALPPDLARRISAHYADDIARLEDLSGCDLARWRRSGTDAGTSGDAGLTAQSNTCVG